MIQTIKGVLALKTVANAFKNSIAKFFIFGLFFVNNLMSEQPSRFKILLVHGTFARTSTWYREGGAFFEQLKQWAQEKSITLELCSFKWSGALSASKRLEAAVELVQFLVQEFGQEDSLVKKIMIGHSHGANVIFLATQMLALAQQEAPFAIRFLHELANTCIMQEKNYPESVEESIMRSLEESQDPEPNNYSDPENLEATGDLQNFVDSLGKKLSAIFSVKRSLQNPIIIDEIFALGSPIDATTYFPAIQSVKRVFSLYSEGDKIQTYSAQFKRKFADFAKLELAKNFITDLKITCGKNLKNLGCEHPKHLDLNSGFIGRWLLELPRLIPSVLPSSNNAQHAWIHFFKDFSRPLPKSI